MVVAELWHNDGEGAASGTTITTSNGNGSGNFPFSAVSTGAGNTAVFSNANPVIGAQSIRLTQAGANQNILGISDADANATLWTGVKNWVVTDIYIDYNATPTATCTIMRLFSDTAYATQVASLAITTTNRVQIINTVGGQSITTPSGAEALTAGNQYLIRHTWDNNTLTQKVEVYDKGQSGTKTEATLTISTGATIGCMRVGITTASAMPTLDFDLWVASGGALARKDIVNTAPVVELGPNIIDIEPFSTISIEANGSDAEGNGTIVSYSIYQKSGPTVTLTPSGNTASYKAPGPVDPAGATMVFGATCTDDQGAVSAEDTVTHTVYQVDRMMWNDAGTLVYIERVPYV